MYLNMDLKICLLGVILLSLFSVLFDHLGLLFYAALTMISAIFFVIINFIVYIHMIKEWIYEKQKSILLKKKIIHNKDDK